MDYQTIQIKCPLECFDDVLGVLEFDEYEFTYGESFDVKVSDFQHGKSSKISWSMFSRSLPLRYRHGFQPITIAVYWLN